jgi:hypothetical protein
VYICCLAAGLQCGDEAEGTQPGGEAGGRGGSSARTPGADAGSSEAGAGGVRQQEAAEAPRRGRAAPGQAAAAAAADQSPRQCCRCADLVSASVVLSNSPRPGHVTQTTWFRQVCKHPDWWTPRMWRFGRCWMCDSMAWWQTCSEGSSSDCSWCWLLCRSLSARAAQQWNAQVRTCGMQFNTSYSFTLVSPGSWLPAMSLLANGQYCTLMNEFVPWGCVIEVWASADRPRLAGGINWRHHPPASLQGNCLCTTRRSASTTPSRRPTHICKALSRSTRYAVHMCCQVYFSSCPPLRSFRGMLYCSYKSFLRPEERVVLTYASFLREPARQTIHGVAGPGHLPHVCNRPVDLDTRPAWGNRPISAFAAAITPASEGSAAGAATASAAAGVLTVLGFVASSCIFHSILLLACRCIFTACDTAA